MDRERLKRVLCNYINLFDYKGVDNLSYIIRQTLDLIQNQEKEIEELNDFIKENTPVIPFIPEDFKKGNDFADLVTLKNKEYISKDKIREILNNAEKNIEEDRPSIVLENLILNIKELLGE